MARARQRAASGPRITAAVCSGQADEPTATAVASLAQQSLPADAYEILVIGDAGAASPAGRIPAPANLRWVAAATEPAAARNLALQQGRAPLLAFLDPHAVAEPGWLTSLCRTFEQFGTLARAVGGRVRPVWEVSRPDWLGDELLAALAVVDLGEEARFIDVNEHLSPANIAFRREHLEAFGGFPPSGNNGSVGAVGGPAESFDEILVAGQAVYDPLAAVDYHVPAERVSQEWFRRRAAWRAVAEVSRLPSPSPAAIAERWLAVKDFFYSCPPSERTIRGLVLQQQDPQRFQQQIAAIYDSLFCLLSGIGEADYG